MRIVVFFLAILFCKAELHSQNEIQTKLPVVETDTIYDKDEVDMVPEFPGGEKAMYSQVYQNMRYPSDAREKGIQGTCILRFVIEKDGSISNPSIVQHVYPSIDLEVMRISKYFDVQWEPAKKNGHPVRYDYRAPLRFVLQ
jgi:protein TonB